MSHNAAAVRATTGWARWSAACLCGWTALAADKFDAADRASEHNALEAVRAVAESLPEDCWDPESCEQYNDDKCARCRLMEALRGVAA